MRCEFFHLLFKLCVPAMCHRSVSATKYAEFFIVFIYKKCATSWCIRHTLSLCGCVRNKCLPAKMYFNQMHGNFAVSNKFYCSTQFSSVVVGWLVVVALLATLVFPDFYSCCPEFMTKTLPSSQLV